MSYAATLPIYDGFSYAAGSVLNGQVTPVGGATWTPSGGANGTYIPVTSGSLSYPNFPTDGNSLLFQSSTVPGTTSIGGNNNTRVNMPSVINTGSVYYSMLVDVASGATSAGVLAAFSPGGAGGGLANYSGGLYIRQDPNNTGQFDLGIGDWNQRLTVNWTSGYNYGTTLFVVGGYTFANDGTTTDDVSNLWVDPALGLKSAPAPTVSQSGADINAAGGSDQIGSFALLQGDDLPTSMGVDEVYTSTNFSDVDPSPVPEPASVGLLSIGALALLRRRRRSIA